MTNMLHMKHTLLITTILSIFSHNTFASQLILEPSINSNESYKLANICFLPDCQDNPIMNGDMNIDINKESKWCKKKGFKYYSSGECPQYYKNIETCKRDEYYLKCDAETWCKDNGYNKISCSLPAYLQNKCSNGLNFYKDCIDDKPKACKQLGYTNTCPSGQKLKKTSGRCSWDNSFGTCCAPSTCPAYTSVTSSSYGTSGTDGCEYACYYTCNMNCPSGTTTSNPGGCGGSVKNGCNTKTCYNPYKDCCSPRCYNEWGCSCGSYSISDGCGSTCNRCSGCCNSSSSNWCAVHGNCHGDCCKDGSIDKCDTRCGGSGCGSSGGGSSGGGSGGSSGGGSTGGGITGTYWCCGGGCGDTSTCQGWGFYPNCSDVACPILNCVPLNGGGNAGYYSC